ncbi:MAG TPA: hypothetical protein VKY74_01960 [Chloroflexia bacterium]|nr:hypothetical protein [Chloroflexia bacterium]
MPKIGKATRRERQRRKAIDSQYQNVRYNTRRAGESLLRREVARTTKLKKKPGA